ncbi:hypothetical protein JOC37_001078 [Desulfohalotomaculum tongense]|uniref:hypothetical protein n=1 Tax=Desulforadius tongensis TaxID=1216062 RepID=UPI001959BBE5|nr:hypothetical protein [Desulforadius tongensis]MBM7854700.1 hypothetical protein [Desulforadius tongensis]
MIIIVAKKLRYRVIQVLRMLFALAILIVLVAQLINTIKSAGISKELNNRYPGGSSIKVEQEVITDREEHKNTLDKLLEKLKAYHRGQ